MRPVRFRTQTNFERLGYGIFTLNVTVVVVIVVFLLRNYSGSGYQEELLAWNVAAITGLPMGLFAPYCSNIAIVALDWIGVSDSKLAYIFGPAFFFIVFSFFQWIMFPAWLANYRK